MATMTDTPELPTGNVSGSVIQRTFVGGNLPAALFAASVPIDEIGVEFLDTEAGMKRLVAEVLSIPPNAVLDETEYGTVVRGLAGQGWRRRLRFVPDPYWEEWALAWERRDRELFHEVESNEQPIRMFAEHSIALMLSSQRPEVPYFGFPLPAEELRRVTKLETDETAIETAIACLGARLRRSRRAADFTRTVLQYDLPFGNSPRTSSDSLLKLLESGKKMCLAPMVAAGTLGVGQLTQGQFVAAILTVGTGSVMSLILLGSVAVGSLLVARVAQSRGRDGGNRVA
jgi:hypothetical protein